MIKYEFQQFGRPNPPKSYKSRSKSGDWVPTFDPPIPSNGDWPKICIPVFVSLRDTFQFSRASYENAYRPEWSVLVNSIRLNGTPRGGDLCDFTNHKLRNLYCPISQRNNHASAFRHACLLHGILISTYIMNTLECLYKWIASWMQISTFWPLQ